MRRILAALAVLAALGLTEPVAHAQGFTQPPTISPYLNLLNNRANPGILYFTQVRPEFAFRGAIRDLQQSNAAIQDWQTGSGTEMPGTGHATGFQTHLAYFGNLGGLRPSPAAGNAMGAGFGGGLVNPLAGQQGSAASRTPAGPR